MKYILKISTILIFLIIIKSCDKPNELKTSVSVKGLETQGEFIESIKEEIQSKYKCKAKLSGAIKFKTSTSLNTLTIKIDSIGIDSLVPNIIASEVSLTIFDKILNSKFKDIFKNLDIQVNKDGNWSLDYELNSNKYSQIKNQIQAGETFLKNWKKDNFKANDYLFHNIYPIDTLMQTLEDTIANIKLRNGKITKQKFIAYYIRPGTLEGKDLDFVYVVFQLDFEKKKDFLRLIFPLKEMESKPKIIGTEGVI